MIKKNKLNKKKGKPTPVNFQETILNLQKFWGNYGCVILQPYDIEVGAGTFHPATTLRSLGNKPWKTAYVQPSRRPSDGRYGDNPNRLQHYYQFQVLIKPSPQNIKKFGKSKGWLAKKLSSSEDQADKLLSIIEERSIWQRYGF